MARPKKAPGMRKLKKCSVCHDKFAELYTATKCHACASDPEHYGTKKAHVRDRCLDQYFDCVSADVPAEDRLRAIQRARMAHEFGEAGLEAHREALRN